MFSQLARHSNELNDERIFNATKNTFNQYMFDVIDMPLGITRGTPYSIKHANKCGRLRSTHMSFFSFTVQQFDIHKSTHYTHGTRYNGEHNIKHA